LKILLDFQTPMVIMVDVMNISDLPALLLLGGFSFSFGFGLALCLDMAQAARRGDLDLPLRQE
jgi:hypothetical protein